LFVWEENTGNQLLLVLHYVF